MSDDWQVGDLAVCVDDARRDPYSVADRVLRRGRVYKVAAVLPPVIYCHTHSVGLVLDGAPNPAPNAHMSSFAATRFRKIKPDQHEPCEEEFRILLQLSKKRVSA